MRVSIAARVRLLTHTGLDWTHKYPAIAAAVASIGIPRAYVDGELCGVGPDGITSFSMIQLASDSGNAGALVFFLFDLLHLDGEDLCPRPLIERKQRLAGLLAEAGSPLHYCDHQVGHGRAFHEKACTMALYLASLCARICMNSGKRCQRRAAGLSAPWSGTRCSRIASMTIPACSRARL